MPDKPKPLAPPRKGLPIYSSEEAKVVESFQVPRPAPRELLDRRPEYNLRHQSWVRKIARQSARQAARNAKPSLLRRIARKLGLRTIPAIGLIYKAAELAEERNNPDNRI